jgi:DNA-binding NarL/FixJ family response regulator
MASTKSIDVFLVDSNPLYREGIIAAIAQSGGITLRGEAVSANNAIESGLLGQVDVVLVECDLPDMSGIELCRWITTHQPETAVLLFADKDLDINLVVAWVNRAAGLLRGNISSKQVVDAIHLASVGLLYTTEELNRIQLWQDEIGSKFSALRPREWQVFWLMTEGTTNQEIGRRLNLAENTVEKHVTSVLQKLGLESRTALFSFSLKNHLQLLSKLPSDWFLLNASL